MKRTILAVALIGLAVAACTPQQVDDAFTAACQAVPVADAAFQVYAGTGKVSAGVIAKERQAVATAQAVCNGPAPTNVQTAIAAVQRALLAIVSATNSAKAQVGA